MVWFFWLAVGVVIYTYIGYGALMWGLVHLLRRDAASLSQDQVDQPAVTLVIPAYNEVGIIDEKLANCNELDYPAEKLTLLFVTDGSADGTVEKLQQHGAVEPGEAPAASADDEAARPTVQFLHAAERQGKPAAMNRAMEHVETPVIIFSDANTRLNRAAVQRLVAHFAQTDVGCVAGEKRVQPMGEGASSAGESLYWRYESSVKRWESAVGSVMGAAGELFALRTPLYAPLPENALLDDFVLSFRIAMDGWRLAYEPAAYALESSSPSIQEEWKRKVRISAGGLQSVLWLAPLLNPLRYGFLTFQYISHRVLRWTVTPLLLLLLLPLNFWLALTVGGVYGPLALLQVFFYAAAGLGWYLARRSVRYKFLFVPFYFVMMNAAVFVGAWRFLRGRQDIRWEKAMRATDG